MEAVILFGFILVILGVAFAVPMASLRGRMVADRDASVLGASILVLGMGSLNYGFLAWFVITGEMEELLLIVGLAPLVAGGLGLLVTRKRLPGIIRSIVGGWWIDSRRTSGILRFQRSPFACSGCRARVRKWPTL
jgi:hypothetical protein